MFGSCSYQREAFKTALAKNTILLLKTGAGKTLVAVLLMKAIAKMLRLPGDKRVAVFIVPTVLLVQQVRPFKRLWIHSIVKDVIRTTYSCSHVQATTFLLLHKTQIYL